MHEIAIILFSVSALALISTYFLYAPVVYIIGVLFCKKTDLTKEVLRTVSVIVPAHNEESVIREKIENLLAQNYPQDKIEIIIASDNSTDQTVAIASSFNNPNIKIFNYTDRGGKMATVAKAVKEATGEILILTDANAMYSLDTIHHLVVPFADASVGCVSGSKNIMKGTSSVITTDAEEKSYWQYENFIKTAETMTGSCVGADGSVYAVRRELFPEVPLQRLVMDDMLVSLKLVLQGYRCVFAPKAQAFEPSETNATVEFRRKARILAGALSVVILLPRLVFGSRISIKFWFHKILRWLTAIFMGVMYLSNSALLNDSLFFNITFAGQTLFYTSALIGFFYDRKGISIPFCKQSYYFMLTVIAQLYGVIIFMRDKNKGHWEKLRNHAA